jgi:hypothetical protein
LAFAVRPLMTSLAGQNVPWADLGGLASLLGLLRLALRVALNVAYFYATFLLGPCLDLATEIVLAFLLGFSAGSLGCLLITLLPHIFGP